MMPDDDLENAALVMQDVMQLLTKLDDADRTRVISAVLSFFPEANVNRSGAVRLQSAPPSDTSPHSVAFSENTDVSPKEFLLDKQPMSDVERVACLAYYLTHYRGAPHFLTLDISKLNTEAAQPKFSNTATTMKNAVKQNYLVSAGKGKMRQLSAGGEQFVQLLPDRKSAREAMQKARPRRRTKRKIIKRKKASTT